MTAPDRLSSDSAVSRIACRSRTPGGACRGHRSREGPRPREEPGLRPPYRLAPTERGREGSVGGLGPSRPTRALIVPGPDANFAGRSQRGPLTLDLHAGTSTSRLTGLPDRRGNSRPRQNRMEFLDPTATPLRRVCRGQHLPPVRRSPPPAPNRRAGADPRRPSDAVSHRAAACSRFRTTAGPRSRLEGRGDRTRPGR